MKEVKRYVRAEVRHKLFERSNGMCESCGTDITLDKHHIHEFCKGGKSNPYNLICLCPNCHRQLPTLLTEDEQHKLQTWHFNNTKRNFAINHHISSHTNDILLGNNIFTGCSSILNIHDRRVIRTYESNGRYYLNAVMLGNYHPQMLVLGNRVIYSSNNVVANVTSDRVSLQSKDSGKEFLALELSNDIVKARVHFTYYDGSSPILFDFDTQSSQVFDNTFAGCTFAADGGAAFSYKGESGGIVRRA